ncbi:hypothetical protein [Polyangium fumosum]|uniref:Uncharacterized protein n=1 Tax=Polyangium fumosum TaxID=889272 RepID=A0A4U1J447_9BACT|nr:hypothetical protein [Polyangium fumosum]TKD01984.1 hypothetical protein E8A74_29395 [Polyangium fumosum]
MPVEEPCKRYYLPLLGNPSDDIELQRKYKTAFGSACYVAADANATFNCFYEEKQLKEKKNGEDGKACADAKRIAEIFGAAPYSKNYKCVKDSGTDDYSLQVGPDPAIKIYIKLGDAPLETSLIEINGMPAEVNGPYQNLVEPSNVGPGKDFHCEKIDNIEQRVRILQVNRKAHGGKIHSDLAGFTYPCGVDENCKPKICTEPDILKNPESTPNQYDPERAEVHHVVRRKDKRLCPWGTNSNKNAAVISGKLNRHLTNNDPSSDEVKRINQVPAYTP